MLKIGTVVDSRSEQHTYWFACASGSHTAQCIPEKPWVMAYRPDLHLLIQFGKGTLHYFAVLQDIGNPGGTTKVVLQDHVATVLVSNKI